METSVFESGNIIVCFPEHPVNRGHLIIRPIMPYNSMDELPSALLNDILKITQTAVRIIKQVFNAPGYSMMQNAAWENRTEDFEIHVFPRWNKKDFCWTYGPDDPEAYKVTLIKSFIENDFAYMMKKD